MVAFALELTASRLLLTEVEFGVGDSVGVMDGLVLMTVGDREGEIEVTTTMGDEDGIKVGVGSEEGMGEGLVGE